MRRAVAKSTRAVLDGIQGGRQGELGTMTGVIGDFVIENWSINFVLIWSPLGLFLKGILQMGC